MSSSAESVLPKSSPEDNSPPFKLRTILDAEALKQLNQRSDRKGWQQLGSHIGILLVSGSLWGQGTWLALPALIVYGFGLASMFAVVHECVHRTAFASPKLNDRVAWLAGVLSFYNSTFYRRYHKWHHRYTQIPGKDPELEDPIPDSWGSYLWQLSGIPWWLGKVQGHFRAIRGDFTGCPYISASAAPEVRRSTLWQLAIYGLAIAISIWQHQPWFITYWVLPLAIGQPILRFILLAEHTGCTKDNNPLSNTRTTLTLLPVRVLMWNMPFHAEHHLSASIPFHALPQTHQLIADKLVHVDPGYVSVNRQLTQQFSAAS
ncbi:MAG: fatty acid desaturase family protein [Cyanobacteria bacterium P01_H01_bin.15]